MSTILDSALPPRRLMTDTWPEHQDTASHTAQKKMEEKKTEGTPKQMVKAKLNRQNHTKKHTCTHSQKEIKVIDRMPKQIVKAKVNRENHTKKHTHTYSQKEKKEDSNQINKQIYQ